MKILLIDADSTRFPNLPLMKISAYHKALGDQVFFRKPCIPDKVYVSCVFTKNAATVRGIASLFRAQGLEVEVGGHGVNDVVLPPEIEHIFPDYSLYGLDYGLGYLTRGCIRNCPWCIVPRFEGALKENAVLSEFLGPGQRKVVLLDNNLLASERIDTILVELIDRKLQVCFTQGLDIRLVDSAIAQCLAKVRCRTRSWKSGLYFSWDNPDDESAILEGISILKKGGVRHRLFFYVLMGFDTEFEDNLRRVKTLAKLKCHPYVMRYNHRTDDERLNRLAKWVNGLYYQFVPFEAFDPKLAH